VSIVGFELRLEEAALFDEGVLAGDFAVADADCFFIIHILV
jgi:hypothetical protein